MSREILDRYREALQRHAEAEKAAIDCRVEVLVIEREIVLLGQSRQSVTKSKVDQFIDDHRGELEADDLEFLSQGYRGGKEVARYLGVSESTLRRLADAGTLETRKTDSGHRRYNTISVVRFLITERSEES